MLISLTYIYLLLLFCPNQLILCIKAHEAVETLPNFTCLTNGCVKSSADLLRNMDLSVKPCNDFYNFACGNFIKKAKISHDKTYVNTFTIINDLLQEQLRLAMEEPIGENEPTPFKSLKKYYRACTNKGNGESCNVIYLNAKLQRYWEYHHSFFITF